jgi:hypothetical protein
MLVLCSIIPNMCLFQCICKELEDSVQSSWYEIGCLLLLTGSKMKDFKDVLSSDPDIKHQLQELNSGTVFFQAVISSLKFTVNETSVVYLVVL